MICITLASLAYVLLHDIMLTDNKRPFSLSINLRHYPAIAGYVIKLMLASLADVTCMNYQSAQFLFYCIFFKRVIMCSWLANEANVTFNSCWFINYREIL